MALAPRHSRWLARAVALFVRGEVKVIALAVLVDIASRGEPVFPAAHCTGAVVVGVHGTRAYARWVVTGVPARGGINRHAAPPLLVLPVTRPGLPPVAAAPSRGCA